MANVIDIKLGHHAMKLAGKLWPIDHHLAGLTQQPDQLCTVGGNWYVVCTDLREQALAKGEIAARGLTVYRPMIAKRERHGRGSMRTITRPMFGAYLFVRCEPTNDHWSRITSARGVQRLISDRDGRASIVPDQAIEVVRLVEAEHAEKERLRIGREAAEAKAKAGGRSGLIWYFAPGDVVRIKEGPFAGFYAELETAVDCHDQVRVLFSLFGRSNRTEISALHIEAVTTKGTDQ